MLMAIVLRSIGEEQQQNKKEKEEAGIKNCMAIRNVHEQQCVVALCKRPPLL